LPDSVLVDIEETKIKCGDCGKLYFKSDVHDHDHDILIESFMPKDNHCGDCGSSKLEDATDPINFETELENYKATKSELLSFYSTYVIYISLSNFY
jgi:ribosomal protein S27AE